MEAVEKKINDEENMSKIESQHRLFQLEDILINVLSKLPVKTLLRFRCVCKRWCYLISDDPYFFRLHSLNSKSVPLLLFSRKYSMRSSAYMPVASMDRKGNPISSFEFNFFTYLPRVIPTRFDLICIHDDETCNIVNPSTHEFTTLPELPDPPFIVRDSVGFGYVESTDEYKVVRLSYFRDSTKCHVFTLGMERRGSTSTSSCSSSSSSSSFSWGWGWREVVDPPIDVEYSSDPAFVNGAIHWMIYGRHVPEKILAFDVKREDFRLVRIPEGFPEHTYPVLMELKGMLSVSYTKDSNMDIWMLKDYYYCGSGNNHINGTWVKEYSINLNICPASYHLEDRCRVAPRAVEETKVLIEKYLRALGYYDLQTKRFKGLVHCGEMEFGSWSFYVESLRSLKQTIRTGIPPPVSII